MKKLNLLKWTAFLFAALVFVACSDDDNKEEKLPAEVKRVEEMQSNDFGTWQYFSFAKGEVVGTGKTDPKTGDDAKWKERTDWDIAFNRYNIRTNSGVSGNGKGGVLKIEGNTFENLKNAPESEYVVDTPVKLIIAMPPKGPQDMPMVGMNTVAKGWVVVKMKGPGNYNTTVTPMLFVVKTADGKYVKLHMKNYQNAKGENGYLTFDYVYQKDGSASF